jgi:hypothetical protein
MRKQIYSFISGRLLAMAGEPVKHIDIWNNQVAFIEEEQPFPTPAVFIEFQPINWRFQGGAVREAQVSIDLHVVTDSRTGRWSDVIEVFDLLDAINRQLHGAHTDGIDDLTALTSTTDNLFGELMHNIETYTCHVLDTSAAPVRQTRPGVKLEINPQ